MKKEVTISDLRKEMSLILRKMAELKVPMVYIVKDHSGGVDVGTNVSAEYAKHLVKVGLDIWTNNKKDYMPIKTIN